MSYSLEPSFSVKEVTLKNVPNIWFHEKFIGEFCMVLKISYQEQNSTLLYYYLNHIFYKDFER